MTAGTSAKGPWKKQEYVLQTADQFPKKVCFVVWGDKIDEYALKENDSVEVSIDIESREFNGKWYTDVKAWKVVKDKDQKNIRVGEDAPLPTEPPLPDDLADDLPF